MALTQGDKIIVTIPKIFGSTNISAVVSDVPEHDPDLVRVIPKNRSINPLWVCVSTQYVRHDL